MMTIFPLSACVIIALFLLHLWWIFFAMCECLLCVTLELWLALCICFSFFGSHEAVGVLELGVQ